MLNARNPLTPAFLALSAMAMIWLGNDLRPAQTRVRSELQVLTPIPLQVLSAFGDRYLGANVNTWRALMVGTQQLSPDELQALAQIQVDASWLNPGHEDNYYLATALLPWEGAIQQTQTVLSRATLARPHDIYPPLYHGFNALHFQNDFATAARSARDAAAHAGDDGTRGFLLTIAARWSDRIQDSRLAVRMVEQMARETHDPQLRAYLAKRVERLEGLAMLKDAASAYANSGKPPLNSLSQLVETGFIRAIPKDPMGGGYTLKEGEPVLLPAKE